MLLGVVAESLKPVKLLAMCKRTQQLSTLLEVGLTVSEADFCTSFKSELIENPRTQYWESAGRLMGGCQLESFSAVEKPFRIHSSTFHVSIKKTLTHWLIVSSKLQSCEVLRIQDHIISASYRKPSIVS